MKTPAFQILNRNRHDIQNTNDLYINIYVLMNRNTRFNKSEIIHYVTFNFNSSHIYCSGKAGVEKYFKKIKSILPIICCNNNNNNKKERKITTNYTF